MLYIYVNSNNDKIMKVLCLFLGIIIINPNYSFSQSNINLRNEFSINLVSFEANSQTLMNRLEPKVGLNLLYSKKFIKGSLNFGLGYSSNMINDYCRSCADAPNGTGVMAESFLSVGYRFLMFRPNRFKLNPFLDVNGYYSRMRYKIDYYSGWGGIYFKDDLYNLLLEHS